MMVCRQLPDVMIGQLGRVPLQLCLLLLCLLWPFVIESYSICKSTLSTISLYLFGGCGSWSEPICFCSRAHFARGIKSDAACSLCLYLIFYLFTLFIMLSNHCWPLFISPPLSPKTVYAEHSNRSGNCKLMSKYCVCSVRTNVSCVSWGDEWSPLRTRIAIAVVAFRSRSRGTSAHTGGEGKEGNVNHRNYKGLHVWCLIDWQIIDCSTKTALGTEEERRHCGWQWERQWQTARRWYRIVLMLLWCEHSTDKCESDANVAMSIAL